MGYQSESGLLQWDKENDCFKAAPEEYGIDEEKIYAINMDDYGNLCWQPIITLSR